jgi:hypothetical protein
MENFNVVLPGSGLQANCKKFLEKHPPSIMSLNITAIEEEVLVYTADVIHEDGSTSHHRLVRDKNGHWQTNLLEDIDHKTNEELKKAIDQYEGGRVGNG